MVWVLYFLFQSSLSFAQVSPTCYLYDFNHTKFPWKLEDCLNFEEVFKNYMYYEAIWDKDLKTLVIRKYSAGKFGSPRRYYYNGKKLAETKR